LARAAVLIAVTIIAFLPATRAGYIWDDDDHIYNNTTLRSAEGLKQIWTEIGATPQYYPLTHTTFWLEYQLWGDSPTGYHINNILLHGLAVLLLWRLLKLMGIPGAWLVAALFAVHPMQVESVAWITERKNVLSGVCYLGSAFWFLRWAGTDHGLDMAPPPRRWYAGSLALYILALTSKTITCTLPAALLIVLWWKRGSVTRRNVLAVLPMFVLGLGFALLTVMMEQQVVGASGADWQYSLAERGLIAGRAWWHYPGKFIWPAPLIFIYPKWSIDAASVWPYVWPVGAGLLFLLLWGLREKIGRGPFAVVAFYSVTISPALGFINVYPMLFSFVADHFGYLACIGPAIGVAACGHLLVQHIGAARTGGVAAGGLVLLLAAMSAQRCMALYDAETLWRDTLAKNPDAWMAHNNLGLIHLNRAEHDTAKIHFQEVLRLRPNAVRAMNNLGSLRLLAGEPRKAQGYFEQAIEHEPDFVSARLNLCKTLFGQGQAQPASSHYLHALKVDPKVAEVEEQLALMLLNALGHEQANDFFDRAIQIRPQWVLLINEMAWILATNPDTARRDAGRAIELASRAADLSSGDDPNILDTLAAAHAASGDYVSAATIAKQAVELAEQQGDDALSVAIHSRLELYFRSKSFPQQR